VNDAIDPRETVPIYDGNSSGEPAQIPQQTTDLSAASDEDPLYENRAAIAVDESGPEEHLTQPNLRRLAVLGAVFFAAIILIAFTIHSRGKPQPTVVATNDLGSQMSGSAGIGGRLIVQWKDSASYRLSVDPLDPADLPAFEDFAGNLPHAIVFGITLKNSSGGVACQKQIVLTSSTAPGSSGQPQNPNTLATATGDTAQGVTNEDGKIAELILSGPLPCQPDAFQRLAAWEFSTDFPPLSEQKALFNQQNASPKPKSGSLPKGRGHRQFATVKSFPASIEGDDAVVSDNPSKNLISTSGGRTFVLGTDLRNGTFSWRYFPGRIHYRCEKNGMCSLTSTESGAAVSARLMQ
jgi:hypothetical protein